MADAFEAKAREIARKAWDESANAYITEFIVRGIAAALRETDRAAERINAASSRSMAEMLARIAALEEALEKEKERCAELAEADDIRDEIARILTIVAVEGLPGPRDLDIAADAIVCTFRDAIRFGNQMPERADG